MLIYRGIRPMVYPLGTSCGANISPEPRHEAVDPDAFWGFDFGRESRGPIAAWSLATCPGFRNLTSTAISSRDGNI
jgi:hypothetical protein